MTATTIKDSIALTQDSSKTTYSQYSARERGTIRVSNLSEGIRSRFYDYDEDSLLESKIKKPLMGKKTVSNPTQFGGLTRMLYEIKSQNEQLIASMSSTKTTGES
tara:strand:+ start:2761 stop:3075 length:315 start_codon:yes stop_codon:yes gene_type:complete